MLYHKSIYAVISYLRTKHTRAREMRLIAKECVSLRA